MLAGRPGVPAPRARGERRRARPRLGGDVGLVALEWAIIAPAVFLLVFVPMQAAWYFHARNLALAAAEEGVRVARADGSSVGAGVARANEFLAESGGQDVLLNSSVAPEGTTEEIRITVSGNAITLMPVFDLSVTQTAAGPVERFTSRTTP